MSAGLGSRQVDQRRQKSVPVPPTPTGFVMYAFDGRDYHALMGSGGESVVAVSKFELLYVGTIGRNVRR